MFRKRITELFGQEEESSEPIIGKYFSITNEEVTVYPSSKSGWGNPTGTIHYNEAAGVFIDRSARDRLVSCKFVDGILSIESATSYLAAKKRENGSVLIFGGYDEDVKKPSKSKRR